VGYYRDGVVVELKPKDATASSMRAAGGGPEDARSARLLDEAISYYQLASRRTAPASSGSRVRPVARSTAVRR